MVSGFHEPGNTVSLAPLEVEILFPGSRYSISTAKLTAALVVLAKVYFFHVSAFHPSSK